MDNQFYVVYGPQGAGKSRIAAVLAAAMGGRVVEPHRLAKYVPAPGDVLVTNMIPPPVYPRATYVEVTGAASRPVDGAEHNRRARYARLRAMRDDLREAAATYGDASADYVLFRQSVLASVASELQFLLDLATSHIEAQDPRRLHQTSKTA